MNRGRSREHHMERALGGRVGVVTGVSRRKGIGFAVADRLAAMGADVFCHGFAPFDAEQPWGADPDGGEEILKELRSHRTRIELMEADFADPDAPRLLLAEPVARQEYPWHRPCTQEIIRAVRQARRCLPPTQAE